MRSRADRTCGRRREYHARVVCRPGKYPLPTVLVRSSSKSKFSSPILTAYAHLRPNQKIRSLARNKLVANPVNCANKNGAVRIAFDLLPQFRYAIVDSAVTGTFSSWPGGAY